MTTNGTNLTNHPTPQSHPYGVTYVSKKTNRLTIERYSTSYERDIAYAILGEYHESVSKIEPGETWVGEGE